MTAPSPENLTAVFAFLAQGLSALGYKEHLDFEVGAHTGLPACLLACVCVSERERERERENVNL